MKKKKARAKIAKKSKARRPAKTKAKTRKMAAKRPAAKAKKAKKPKKTKKTKAVVAPRQQGVIAPVGGVLLGFVEDYYAKIGVVALTLKAPLAVGQRVQIIGHTTNFEQTVDSMQIDHMAVTQAASGDGVGIKVRDRARGRDHVYLLK